MDFYYETIFDEAKEAARKAVAEEIAREPEDMNTLDCGFAWVIISGKDRLTTWCKKQILKKGFKIEPSGNLTPVRTFKTNDERWAAQHACHLYGGRGYPKG